MATQLEELIIYNTDSIGFPPNSNVLWIDSHGSRKGNKIFIVPDNVYIISPCKDDLSWAEGQHYTSKISHVKATNKIDSENIESYTGMWGDNHDIASKVHKMVGIFFRKLRLDVSENNFNSLLTKKIFVKLNSLEQGDNINNVFRWGV